MLLYHLSHQYHTGAGSTGACTLRCHLLRGGVESSRAAHLQPRMTSLLKSVGLRMVHPTVSFSFRRASAGQRMRTPYRG